MESFTPLRDILRGIFVGAAGIFLIGCSTPMNITADRLGALGVVDGAMYWEAQQKLAQEGYRCFVTGAKRENFDCTRTVGFFPTCVMRVTFVADDKNLVSRLNAPNAACMGTP